MRILVVTFARRSQFSGMLDVLCRSHLVTLLSPPGYHPSSRIIAWDFTPVKGSGESRTDRLVSSFLGNGSAVAETLLSRPANFDVVLVQAEFGLGCQIVTTLTCPMVAHVEFGGLELAHSRVEFPPNSEELNMHVIKTALVCETLESARRVVTPSRYSLSMLPGTVIAKSDASLEGIRVGPYRTFNERNNLKAQFGLNPEIPVIGYFGRTLEAFRGFDIFVAAALKIRRKIPNVVFIVLGSEKTVYGNESRFLKGESFKSYALRSNDASESDFRWFPPLDHLLYRELISTADVALFPLFESAGHWSLMDCLAEGTPVVVPNRCCFPEMIRHLETGFIASDLTSDAMAEGALHLLDSTDERKCISRRAWEMARDQLDVPIAAKRYERILEKAASRN